MVTKSTTSKILCGCENQYRRNEEEATDNVKEDHLVKNWCEGLAELDYLYVTLNANRN
jgi:hypothetical protein